MSLETEIQSNIATVASKVTVDGSEVAVKADLARLRSEIPSHWSSVRVWVAVLAIAAAAYIFRHDLSAMANIVLPAAKQIIIALICATAAVEVATVISGALKK